MKISELKPRQSGVEVEGKIVKIGEAREFSSYGRQLRVVTAKIKDDSGSIDLSLWNEDIGKIKVGDKVKISNGFVKEFQGENQLTTGKFGKLEVIGKGKEEAEEEESEEKAEEEPEEEFGEEESEEEAGEEESEEEE